MHHWNTEEETWLRNNYPQHTVCELASLFAVAFEPVSEGSIRAKLCKLGVNGKVDTSPLTVEENSWLEANYGNKSISELVKEFNSKFAKHKTENALSAICTYRGLRKKKKAYRFNRQQVDFFKEKYPIMSVGAFVDLFNREFNTSLSRELLIDKARRLGVKATMAKLECTQKAVAAAITVNKSPIGAERYNKKKGKWVVKVADVPYGHRNWIDKKDVVWAKRHGEIPEGMHVIQLDGDGTNYDDENMMLVSAWVHHKFRLFSRTHDIQTRELVRTYVMAWQLMEVCRK